jgi:hypothetical protein
MYILRRHFAAFRRPAPIPDITGLHFSGRKILCLSLICTSCCCRSSPCAGHVMAMVELMRERREDGCSLAMIADAFNGDHIPGKNGGKWYGRTVKNVLEKSVYENVGSGGA